MTDLLQNWLLEYQWSATGWMLFVLAFAATQVVFIPRTAVSLASGALFGVTVLPLIAAGTTLGAVIAFLLARYVVSKPVQRMIDRRPRVKRVLHAVDAEGWRLVAVSRCGVPIPAALVNYSFGVTNIRLWSFTWATFAFCIPHAALFLYLGAVGRSVLLGEPGAMQNLPVLLLGVASSALAFYLVSSRMRASAQPPTRPRFNRADGASSERNEPSED
jgi:uncharacterized membrane protein YdjX (TVP38/TMEM64 family)